MAFSYHKPTREYCEVCQQLEKTENDTPLITTFDGKASSANNFPFHNWYNFVLGYAPDFPLYIINKYHITSNHVILDPFMGTATTNVVAKSLGIKSIGVEANDYFINVGNAKLYWDVDCDLIEKMTSDILSTIDRQLKKINFLDDDLSSNKKVYYRELAQNRPEGLTPRYISDRPFVKLSIIKNVIKKKIKKSDAEYLWPFYHTAFSSIIVPSSNVSYGPGFGVNKPKEDVDVIGLFTRKLERMTSDLRAVENDDVKKTPFRIIWGDSRNLAEYLEPNSVDFLITSPPYPGDHEYTKHTKLELMMGMDVLTLNDFRTIKKRMLVGSTTNIYKENNDRQYVEGNHLITEVTNEIQRRLDADGATSGFEKLYTKLVWEYFGGMAKMFMEAYKVMKVGGKFSLLVSDSHAFKMVHIRTAVILGDIARNLGFSDVEIELWQNKRSTSHHYNLREEILTITK